MGVNVPGVMEFKQTQGGGGGSWIIFKILLSNYKVLTKQFFKISINYIKETNFSLIATKTMF